MSKKLVLSLVLAVSFLVATNVRATDDVVVFTDGSGLLRVLPASVIGEHGQPGLAYLHLTNTPSSPGKDYLFTDHSDRLLPGLPGISRDVYAFWGEAWFPGDDSDSPIWTAVRIGGTNLESLFINGQDVGGVVNLSSEFSFWYVLNDAGNALFHLEYFAQANRNWALTATIFDHEIPVVPAPATLAVLGMGLAGLGFARRRQLLKK